MIRIKCIHLSALLLIYDLSPPLVGWWSSMSSFLYLCHIQKGSHSGAVRSFLPESTYSCWYTQFYYILLALKKTYLVSPWSCTQCWGINILYLYYSECGNTTWSMDSRPMFHNKSPLTRPPVPQNPMTIQWKISILSTICNQTDLPPLHIHPWYYTISPIHPTWFVWVIINDYRLLGAD